MQTHIPSTYVAIHPEIRLVTATGEALLDAVQGGINTIHKTYKKSARRRCGGTLRPGSKTPLWNALAAEARSLIRKRGDKANLGRHLGVPRQRIHEFLKARSAAPDAERALELLHWVRAHRSRRSSANPTGGLSRIT